MNRVKGWKGFREHRTGQKGSGKDNGRLISFRREQSVFAILFHTETNWRAQKKKKVTKRKRTFHPRGVKPEVLHLMDSHDEPLQRQTELLVCQLFTNYTEYTAEIKVCVLLNEGID